MQWFLNKSKWIDEKIKNKKITAPLKKKKETSPPCKHEFQHKLLQLNWPAVKKATILWNEILTKKNLAMYTFF